MKWIELKIAARYALFWLAFALCFAVMFVLLCAAVFGMPLGVILAIFGTAILVFRADFIISGIAPEIMLFGGLTIVCTALFLGMTAVKAGYCVSRFFLDTRRHCEKLHAEAKAARALNAALARSADAEETDADDEDGVTEEVEAAPTREQPGDTAGENSE